MTIFNWTCGFCQMPQVGTDQNSHEPWGRIQIGDNAQGNIGGGWVATACQNQECKEVSLTFVLTEASYAANGWQMGTEIARWTLLPEPSGKPQPDFIPIALRTDYLEACRIRDLSPKASATLARRCLQGMIRDFCGIAEKTLFKEIAELKKRIDAGQAPQGVTIESVDAIDAVRTVGNIGAHMESDVNLIVDIEPGEAQLLIELVETLFDDWYVAREKRRQRFEAIKNLSNEKKQVIIDAKA